MEFTSSKENTEPRVLHVHFDEDEEANEGFLSEDTERKKIGKNLILMSK